MAAAAPGSVEPGTVLEWSVHPAAARPVRSALAVMAVAFVAGALYRATGTMVYSAVAVLVSLVTLSPFFFRTEYRMDDAGITQKRAGRSRRLEWPAIRTVTVGRDTVFVSPERSRSIRESRGVLLLCPGKSESVAGFIRLRRNAPSTLVPDPGEPPAE